MQAMHGHPGQEVEDREVGNGIVSLGQGRGQKDEVRKKGRHRTREGDKTGEPGNAGQRERGRAERREREDKTKRENGGRQRTSRAFGAQAGNLLPRQF